MDRTLRAYVHLNVTLQISKCQNIVTWAYLRETLLFGSAEHYNVGLRETLLFRSAEYYNVGLSKGNSSVR